MATGKEADAIRGRGAWKLSIVVRFFVAIVLAKSQDACPLLTSFPFSFELSIKKKSTQLQCNEDNKVREQGAHLQWQLEVYEMT